MTADLRASLPPAELRGRTAIVTITAPIRLPSKTAEEVRRHIVQGVERRSSADVSCDVNGNGIRIRFVTCAPGTVVVLVHNRETPADALLEAASECISARGTVRSALDPVLVRSVRSQVCAETVQSEQAPS